ncbi:MAG: RNA polymerase sporulation sigma factor SigH [Clostridia bacterium]|nr:RNA polymerase sporulation sigma factor SigH [Clostridia bacterium]
MTHNQYLDASDAELVRLARGDDSQALELLYERYKSLVRIKARPYYILGADRDDIVQEGMIGLFKAIRDYNPEKHAAFRTFADLCIQRQILTAIQNASRQKHSPLNTYVSLSTPLAGDDPDRTLIDVMPLREHTNPEDIVISNESLERLHVGLVQNLTRLELQVLTLYVRGLSYQEIAKRLGKGVKTVDNALQRVKRKVLRLRDSDLA